MVESSCFRRQLQQSNIELALRTTCLLIQMAELQRCVNLQHHLISRKRVIFGCCFYNGFAAEALRIFEPLLNDGKVKPPKVRLKSNEHERHEWSPRPRSSSHRPSSQQRSPLLTNPLRSSSRKSPKQVRRICLRASGTSGSRTVRRIVSSMV